MPKINLPKPAAFPFDYKKWEAAPFPQRVKKACAAWAMQGYGAPASVYAFYFFKMALYIGGWLFFCSLHTNLGGIAEINNWWFQLEALEVALLWSILFEILGLGCGSGPLTGRYMPPVAACLHNIRPGTIKLPMFPKLPLIGGDTRNWFDVTAYVLFILLIVRALINPLLTLELILPIIILLPILGLLDKTLFLMARAEHYWIALLCFLFPADTTEGLKLIWLAIWWGAASSKLNRHFPSVVAVMVSNHPIIKSTRIKKWLYKNYPENLQTSKLTNMLAHFGTLVEYSFPVLLLLGNGGTLTFVALGIMLVFHCYITFCFPMGVPLEWNVITVYGALVLFGYHTNIFPFAIESVPLIAILIIALLLLPVLGNLFPKWISFLLSMRYYAGNWAYSVWLFKKGKQQILDDHIIKTAQTIDKQLSLFYDEETIGTVKGRLLAFRHMHLHGRALHQLIPKAVDNIEQYDYDDGELVANIVLGWNFGEGHLHGKQLLQAIQKRCNFQPGDLRCIFVESQPIHKPFHHWQIHDASDGLVEEGEVDVRQLIRLQPYPN